MRDNDSKESSKGEERKCIAAGINEASSDYREYTLPFTAKTLSSYSNKDQVSLQQQYHCQYMKKDQVKNLDR
jgi:hypothetical protein